MPASTAANGFKSSPLGQGTHSIQSNVYPLIQCRPSSTQIVAHQNDKVRESKTNLDSHAYVIFELVKNLGGEKSLIHVCEV